MYEINQYLLTKMGWTSYSSWNGIKLANNVITDEEHIVKFHIDDKERKILFVIKELTEKEKQKSKNLYKFLIIEYNDVTLKSTKTLKKFLSEEKVNNKIIEFNSNLELYDLIIKNEACSTVYQRHFRINKLLKK